MTYVYVLSLIIASTALVGLLFGRRVEGFLAKYSSPVLGVSVGILSITVFHLGYEAIEESALFWHAGLAILAGFVFADMLHRFSHETHCHHGHDEHEHHDEGQLARRDLVGGPVQNQDSSGVLRKVVVGDSIHNLIDGFTLAAVSVSLPLATLPLAFSMFLHESIQEVAEFLVLKEAGIPKKKIILYNLLSGLSIVLGVFLGLSLSFVHELVPYLAGFSAGILAHFMTYDGVNIVFKPAKGKSVAIHAFSALYVLGGIALGFALLEMFSTHA